MANNHQDVLATDSITVLRGFRFSRDAPPAPDEHPCDAAAVSRQFLTFRKRYLSKALRISAQLSPKLHEQICAVSQRLGGSLAVEAYVYCDPSVQACSFSGSTDRTIGIAFSSGVVNLLSPQELCFVIGHEIGHYIMQHDRCVDVQSVANHVERLNALSLSRAAEISADRIGFLACESREYAYRTIIKTASGLNEELLRFDISAYIDQARDLFSYGGLEDEIESTHPMFIARLRALLWFEVSEPYNAWDDNIHHASIDRELLDRKIHHDLMAVSGFKLLNINEDAIRAALLWGAISVFLSDGHLTQAEQSLLKVFFGDSQANKAINFVRMSGPHGVSEKFSEQIQSLSSVPLETRDALFDDLQYFAGVAGGDVASRLLWLRGVCSKLLLKRTPSISDEGFISEAEHVLKTDLIFEASAQLKQRYS